MIASHFISFVRTLWSGIWSDLTKTFRASTAAPSWRPASTRATSSPTTRQTSWSRTSAARARRASVPRRATTSTWTSTPGFVRTLARCALLLSAAPEICTRTSGRCTKASRGETRRLDLQRHLVIVFFQIRDILFRCFLEKIKDDEIIFMFDLNGLRSIHLWFEKKFEWIILILWKLSLFKKRFFLSLLPTSKKMISLYWVTWVATYLILFGFVQADSNPLQQHPFFHKSLPFEANVDLLLWWNVWTFTGV